ncbi:MAG: hypothetical protein WCC12_04260 [Anaerolineales bacterium]
MNTPLTNQPKPTLVNVIAWMTLASGIVNLFWGLIASLSVAVTVVGLLCTPFTVLPTVLGIFEIIYAAKLLSNPPQAVQPSTTIAILEIVCILALNVFSVVVGILALVFYNDITVRDYFAQLNGTFVPTAPVVPAIPASVPEPAPVPAPEMVAPAAPEEFRPVEGAPAPEPPQPAEAPAKPKRARKVAK